MGVLLCKDVLKLTKLSRVSLWRLQRAGTFPVRRKLSPGRVCWDEEEVLAWLKNLPPVDGGSKKSSMEEK